MVTPLGHPSPVETYKRLAIQEDLSHMSVQGM
uniref:Uncharacterized protein n=1 Tax=Arundo donax TaxID=35708 RepID=A0A0A8YUL0_ARUDO